MPELVCAADSPDWLTERRKGITATDITAITGLSPYESAYSLFFKKRGDIPDTHEDTPRLALGRELEPYILKLWRQANDSDTGWNGWLMRSTARPWQMATMDAMTGIRNDTPGLPVEVKSWADADRDRWHDAPPARVRAQVLWQMDTLDVATGHVGVLFLPSGEFRSYIVEHSEPRHLVWDDLNDGKGDCETCRDMFLLRSAGRDFMDRLDLNQPPSPDASSATLAAIKARFTDVHHDKQAEINGNDFEQWHRAKILRDGLDEQVRRLEATIREQAGEARTLTVGGTKVATRVVGDAEVKAHTRHSDYIRRATSKGDTDA